MEEVLAVPFGMPAAAEEDGETEGTVSHRGKNKEERTLITQINSLFSIVFCFDPFFNVIFCYILFCFDSFSSLLTCSVLDRSFIFYSTLLYFALLFFLLYSVMSYSVRTNPFSSVIFSCSECNE